MNYRVVECLSRASVAKYSKPMGKVRNKDAASSVAHGKPYPRILRHKIHVVLLCPVVAAWVGNVRKSCVADAKSDRSIVAVGVVVRT